MTGQKYNAKFESKQARITDFQEMKFQVKQRTNSDSIADPVQKHGHWYHLKKNFPLVALSLPGML